MTDEEILHEDKRLREMQQRFYKDGFMVSTNPLIALSANLIRLKEKLPEYLEKLENELREN